MKQVSLLLTSLLQLSLMASFGDLPPVPASSDPDVRQISPAVLRDQIEADWLRQALAIQEGGTGGVSAESDARGGCDGIKDGKYGFHTDQETKPWWQVDLGQPCRINRIIVFNRLDYSPGLHNADHLLVLTSEDGQEWVVQHENKGIHFGGITGSPPLELHFGEKQVNAQFVRLQVQSTTPIFFHLDEVEIFGWKLDRTEEGAVPSVDETNLALHRSAFQSSMSQWSTAKQLPLTNLQFPTKEWIQRGRNLAADLQQLGLEVSEHLMRLKEVEGFLENTPAAETEETRRTLYLKTRWLIRALALNNPLLDFEQLLFVKRYTQESYPDVCLNHMPWVSRPGGDICVLFAPKGQKLFSSLANPAHSGTAVRHVLNGALAPGHVHGIDLCWDGTRVVFGYARAKTDHPSEGWLDRSRSYVLRRTVEPIHVFEVGVTGQQLRQLTFGEWSDLDPTYAPNGDIVFVSERCGTSLQCNEYDKDETSCNLYVMRPDGSGIRRLSVNKDGDYLPHTLDDGTIAYVRWEYQERSWAYIQSIWTIRPDGTGADAIFKQHLVNPWALEDTRSIPGSSKLVSIAAGHHTLAVGPIVVIDLSMGVNEPKAIGIVTPDVRPTEGGMDGTVLPEGGTQDGRGLYSTPWALSEKYFLTAYSYSNKETDPTGYGLYLVDVFGNKELLFRDPEISSFTPVPLRSRKRPPVLPELIDLARTNATCVVSEIGLGSEEVADRVRYLRIAEPIGWPYDNLRGGQRYGEKGPNLINWTPVRILGDVPVAKDGSVRFEVPADTAVYFQLLDENRMELRRMRSFISFQPGEERACVGCHETRALTASPHCPPEAAALPVTEPLPAPWGTRPISFLRDVQPILDLHCGSCHSGLKPAGNLDFSGGPTDWSIEFEEWWGLVPGYGFNRAFETIYRKGLVAVAEPNLQDASITPPLKYGAHKSILFQTLSQEPHLSRVQLYPQERLALTMWMDANAPYHDRFVDKRAEHRPYDLAVDRELASRMRAVHERRCASCHDPGEVTRLDWIDVRQPQRTLFLRAPLKKAAGGSQTCQGMVYADPSDEDYCAVLKLLEEAVGRAWKHPRRDIQSLIR